MKSYFLSLISIALALQVSAQPFPKAVQILGSGPDDPFSATTDIVQDGDGNIII